MDAGSSIIVALAAPLLIACAASSRRPARSRLKSRAPLRQPVRTLAERFGSIVAETNTYLLVLAIGLGALDLLGMAAVRLPDLMVAAANGDQGEPPAAANLMTASTTPMGF